MKEFKIGEKCYVEYEVTAINKCYEYPIKCVYGDDGNETFTLDGKKCSNDEQPTLKHIEDIIPEPEFPKWMMIKTHNHQWVKRKVIYNDNAGYVFILTGGEDISLGVDTAPLHNVKEIEPENIKLQELEIKYKELGEEINKLKNQ